MSSIKFVPDQDHVVPSIIPAGGWGLMVGGGTFGLYRLHARSFRHCPPCASTRDDNQPRWIEVKYLEVPTMFRKPNMPAGIQQNPYNMVVERAKGLWFASRGTTTMSDPTLWVRPAAMRTRGMINKARLTRMEPVAHHRGSP